MTTEEYEQRYAEALKDIRAKIVGKPDRTHDGVRFVEIDGKRCTDDVVFTKAWGHETAVDIMRQKPPPPR